VKTARRLSMSLSIPYPVATFQKGSAPWKHASYAGMSLLAAAARWCPTGTHTGSTYRSAPAAFDASRFGPSPVARSISLSVGTTQSAASGQSNSPVHVVGHAEAAGGRAYGNDRAAPARVVSVSVR
jgi:hypothetical protein